MCASSSAAVTVRTEVSNDSSRAWAIFFARVILGLIFFMAGVWKTFTLTPFGLREARNTDMHVTSRA